MQMVGNADTSNRFTVMQRKDFMQVFENCPLAVPPGKSEWLLLDGEHRAVLFYNDQGMRDKYGV